MIQKHLTPTVPVNVGTPVWYVPNADHLGNPLPATIVNVTDNLVATLMIILPDGGWDRRLAVYPLGSKFLVGPNGKANPNAVRNGAWVYHPDFIPKQPELAVAADVTKETVSNEVKPDATGEQDAESGSSNSDIPSGDSTVDNPVAGGEGGGASKAASEEAASYSKEDIETVLRLFGQHGDVDRLYRQVRGRKLDRKEVDEILAKHGK